MRTQTVAVLVSSALLAAAFTGSRAGEPASAGMMEEIVVTGRYPAAPLIEGAADPATDSGTADGKITAAASNEPPAPVTEEIVVIGRYPAPSAEASAPPGGRPIKLAVRSDSAPPAARRAAIGLPQIDPVKL